MTKHFAEKSPIYPYLTAKTIKKKVTYNYAGFVGEIVRNNNLYIVSEITGKRQIVGSGTTMEAALRAFERAVQADLDKKAERFKLSKLNRRFVKMKAIHSRINKVNHNALKRRADKNFRLTKKKQSNNICNANRRIRKTVKLNLKTPEGRLALAVLLRSSKKPGPVKNINEVVLDQLLKFDYIRIEPIIDFNEFQTSGYMDHCILPTPAGLKAIERYLEARQALFKERRL